jgi:glyoxylase-like metal-dependent hydrolase (beta-lactamase superfamily II)
MGGHRLELIALDGHTGADLAILDRSTGVLFAGDLIFHDRAPHHAPRPPARLAGLPRHAGGAALHGTSCPATAPSPRDAGPIRQTRAWLAGSTATLRQAADDGLDMTEVLALASARRVPPAGRGGRRIPPLRGQLYPALRAAGAFRDRRKARE